MRLSEKNITALKNKHRKILKDFHNFACGDGWFDIIDELCWYVEKYCERYDLEIPKCTCMKEKFGLLRVHFDTMHLVEEHQWTILKLCLDTEKESSFICESCSNLGKLRRGNWLKTLCDECFVEWNKRD